MKIKRNRPKLIVLLFTCVAFNIGMCFEIFVENVAKALPLWASIVVSVLVFSLTLLLAFMLIDGGVNTRLEDE